MRKANRTRNFGFLFLPLKQELFSIGMIVLIVLAGYYKIFLGADFFIHENYLAESQYTYGNTLGNGWRPDKGLGLSFFFADLGMWHPWGVLTWLERISPSRVFAYNFSIIFLGILSAVALYFFILKILPDVDKRVAVLLAPLIVFCADQGGYHFLRLSISLLVVMPLFLMVLFDYYESPRAVHFFTVAFLFWFVAFLGNLWSLSQLWSLGFVFTIFYVIYFKSSWGKIFGRLFLLYGLAVIVFIALGFWEIYSLLWEKNMVGYVREKAFELTGITYGLNWKMLPHYLGGLIQAELLPANGSLAGLGNRIFIYVFNVAVIFPLVFLFFLFRRAVNFWEFALKGILVVFVVHYGLLLTNIIPGYGPIFAYINHITLKVFTMYDSIFPLQVALMAMFIVMMKEDNVSIRNPWGRGLQWVVAFGLLVLYLAMTVFVLIAVLAPALWPYALIEKMLGKVLPSHWGGYSRELLIAIILHNMERLQDMMRWSSILFYATSVGLVVPFLKNQWLQAVSQKSKVWIAALVLANGIFLSWSIFPLNERKSIWEQGAMKNVSFNPTDRFYFIKDPAQKMKRTLEAFKERWVEVEGGGPREHFIGLLEPPGLSISGLKSFATKDEGEFIYHIFNGDGVQRLINLRLTYGGPLRYSELLDMAAVKYYYSDRPIPNIPDYFTLYAKAKQLYVYKNNLAWPYFYLAKKVDYWKEGEHLKNVQQDTAYVLEKDKFSLSAGAGLGSVTLKSFRYGQMVFDFNSRLDEFLVVADAWHPLWRAKTADQELKVIRANQIFKGIRLPAGQYELRLFFDPSRYKIGIYISVVSWLLFLIGFGMARQSKVKIKF